ncbi:MAG: hypothetical protein HY891_00530 [Deltaproteobacteria bacterium]|nr:hypothetical protein [Deltaproteobacteria bacterium]
MFKRVFLAALTVVLVSSLAYVPAVNSQGLSVISKSVKGDLPADPRSSAWDKVDGITIPMSSQIIANPRAFALPKGKSSVRWVSVRSINNGKEIAFLLEWDDMTENSLVEDTSTYRDAVALEFPVNTPKREAENPYFAMGHEGMPVNIWQWKADLEGGRDRIVPIGASYPGEGLKYSVDWYQGRLYQLPSKERKGPVEDLNAERFGTLTLQDSQDVMGKGAWSGGKWRVVFFRSMSGKDKEDVQFKKKDIIPIAFAVWDGSNKEKDGQKSITTWHELKIE